MGLPAVHSVLRWVENATGKSPKKRGPGNKARYILHAYRKCGGARQDEREPWMRERKSRSPYTWKASKTEYTPRENGRSRRRGLNRTVEKGAEGFFVFLRHSTPWYTHVDRSEPDMIWLHSRPCPGINPVLWSPGDYDAVCTGRAHAKMEKKSGSLQWNAGVTLPARTPHCAYATYCRCTFTGYRRFYVALDIAYPYGINAVE